MHLVIAMALAAAAPSPGEGFIKLLQQGHAELAEAEFDATMTKAMPLGKLHALWDADVTELGPFQKFDGVETHEVDEHRVDDVICVFAKGRHTWRVVFDAHGKVAGLFVRPTLLVDSAKTVLELLRAHQFASAAALLSPTTGGTALTMKQGWDVLAGRHGPLLSVKGYHEQGGGAVVADCVFERDEVKLLLTFNTAGQLMGITPKQEEKRTGLSYVDASRFESRAVQVGTLKLRGTLLVPKSADKFPGVVLVAGSGPADQDETNQGMKPFKDIAEGLASRGIAVLRYDKRTYKGVAKKIHTVQDEYLDDANAAIALLAATPGVQKVFVLGHSMGGALAPRIAQQNPKVAGLVMLAPPSWPYAKGTVAQLEYQKELGVPGLDPMLEKARREAKEIDDPKLKPDDRVGDSGLTGAYFLDLRGYSPVDAATALTLPIFIGWGERDMKVIPADFDGWRPLGKKTGVTLKTYSGLHHLLMPVGMNNAHITPEVMEDLATWVEKIAGA